MMIQNVWDKFNLPSIQASQPLTGGLINHSYKVTSNNGNSFFLQRINTSVFTNPTALQNNYKQIQAHLSLQKAMNLPKLIPATSGDLFYKENNEVWRCFEFLDDTYSPPSVQTVETAYEVANCFGFFTSALQNFDNSQIATILPHFHDLALRFQQFEAAFKKAPAKKISEVKSLIQRVEEYRFLISWYHSICSDKTSFPLHILHHDCKISNILFDIKTNLIRCPIDLDTTQPGLFFSDVGDMVRTIVPNKNEEATELADIAVRPDFFKAVTEGYLDAMASFLTPEERNNIHTSGSIMIYMQAVRFLTDYLNGNIYYKTEYGEQNKNRAANQLRLLFLLQEYVKDKKQAYTFVL